MAGEPEMNARQRELAARYGLERARPVERGWVLADDSRRPPATQDRTARRRGRGRN